MLRVLRGVGQRGVRADRDALHALGAVLGDVERGFAAGDVFGGGVAGGGGDDAHGGERRGGLIVAEVGAELGVEVVDAGDRRTRALAGGRRCGTAAAVAQLPASPSGNRFEDGQQRLAAQGGVVGGG